MYKRFGKNDCIFIGFLALFCVLVCVWVYKGGAVTGSFVTVTVDGKEVGTYSLLEEQTITIGEGGLKPGAEIGIMLDSGTGVFATNASKTDAQYFTATNGSKISWNSKTEELSVEAAS